MDKKFPMISVIVPVYNAEPYIYKCIESIRNQTYHNIEIILVDDGSKDQSSKICDQIALEDDRIRVIHQENLGPSAARNNGIKCSRGEFVSFIDSDDTIETQMLEVLYKRLSIDGADLALCGLKRLNQKDQLVCEITLPNGKVTGFQALEMWYQEKGVLMVSPCNKLYKASLFHDIQFPDGRFHEDEYTLYRILDRCNWVSIVDQTMYSYFARDGSIMEREYSIRRLDGVEASFLRYQYFKEKGGRYLQFLQQEGDVFAPLYFRNKTQFYPKSKEEKRRAKELDKMAKVICFDQFTKWTFMRKVRLLLPELIIFVNKAKRFTGRKANHADSKRQQ